VDEDVEEGLAGCGGCVERAPDPADRRARLVRLAERALQAQSVADGVVAEVEKEWEEHLGKRRMKQLREALTLLREITAPWAYTPTLAASSTSSREALWRSSSKALRPPRRPNRRLARRM